MSRKRIGWLVALISMVLAINYLWSHCLSWDDLAQPYPANVTYYNEVDLESILSPAGSADTTITLSEQPSELQTKLQPELPSELPTLNEWPASSPSITPTPIPGNGSVGKSPTSVRKGLHVLVNLDEMKLYLYKDGVLQKTYPCSGGKRSTPSPVGSYRIIGKDTWGEGFGGAWMAINVPYGKYGIHGTVYPYVIGKSNSSKGCIRMLNKDAQELYKLVSVGTTVTIVHDRQPFRSLKSGDIGPDVERVQKALKKLGYFKSGANGRFGNSLGSSISKFQKDNRLRVSGTVDRKTYDLIINKANSLGEN